MFSQWATKRVVKFAMKHLLGRILRNELDLEQLDVQIGSGTIHLKDLALNIDYFNDQLAEASPVVFKEGCVGSATAKNLWSIYLNDQPCEVEVHDLELVFVPRVRPQRTSTDEDFRGPIMGHVASEGNEADGGAAGGTDAAYLDIEVGVRAIAQIVEKVLLGLCVKVTNLVIVFEEQSQQETTSRTLDPQKIELDSRLQCTLLVRAAYIEYGNDIPLSQAKGAESTMLVKGVKFKCVTVELLPEAATVESEGGLTSNELLDHAMPILTGEDGGGVSGSMQLRIPIRDGSLDVPKINTEFLVQPFKVWASVWRIQQLFILFQSISRRKREMEETVRVVDKKGERFERLVGMLSTRSVEGAEGGVAASSVFLPATSLISDWMRWGGTDSQKIPGAVAEADLAASVDEFFECLDTGSMLLATDAWKQVEYSVKAKLIGLSVELEYEDIGRGGAYISQEGVEEHLQLHLGETFVSVAVSEKKTELSFTMADVELFEEALQDLKEVSGPLKENIDTLETLSKLVEETLPPYPVSLYLSVKGRTLSSRSLRAGPKWVRRKQLLRVTSFETSPSMQLNLRRQTISQEAKRTGDEEAPWCMDVEAKCQPVIIWLDFRTVERVVKLISQIRTPDLQKPERKQRPGNGSTKLANSSNSLRMKSCISSIRVVTFLPLDKGDCGFKNARAFFALDLAKLSLDLQLSDAINANANSLVLCTGDAAVYLVCAKVKSSDEDIASEDGLHAERILRIKQQNEFIVSVEVASNRLADTGPWIAKQAWDVAVAQKRRGDGGGGIGGCNFEFVAATSAEAAEEADVLLGEKLIKSSSTVIQIRLPIVTLELSRSQYLLFVELVAFVTSMMDLKGHERMVSTKGLSTTSLPILVSEGPQGSQTSVLVQCGRMDMLLDLRPTDMAEGTKSWDVLHFDIEKLQALSVLQMGATSDAFYLRVRHEECQVSGSPPHTWDSPLQGETEEVILFACRNSALQRGNGGGGNVLAVGSAGITVTYVAWPYRERLADDFLIGNLKGCTIVAHGGRLDWITTLISFFAITSQGVANHVDPIPEAKTPWRIYFLLDLHDVALGYEPGLEALQAPEAAPVAFVLAATAVRVSTGERSEIFSDNYDVRLRDVALHVLNTEFKRQTQLTYSTESMQSMGFIQVAKETSMGVVVRIGGEEGRRWEVDCGNNEICFDTCHDTTAAFGQLIAQLQQLFAPPMEQPSVQIKVHNVEVQAANVGEVPGLLDGVLENAFVGVQNTELEPVDLQSSELSSKDIQEFIEDYVSGQTPGGLSELLDDSIQYVKGPPKSRRGGNPGGGWYEGNILKVVEDHIPVEQAPVKPSLPKKYPKSVGQAVLQNMSVRWRLHEGSDWPSGDEDPNCNMEGVVGESGRKPDVCLEVFLNGVNVQYDVFPIVGLYASKLTVTISDFGVHDCSPDAPWKMVMGYHQVASRPRETSSQAVKIEMDAVRPDPTDALEEYRVSFALLPIRLHLDQRHIDFCTNFFSSHYGGSQGTSVDENLNLSRGSSLNSSPSVGSNITDSPTEPLLPFFQIFEVLPLNIRVDYLPRRVDLAALRAGNYAELVNMVQWKGIELHLKHVRAAGVHGLSSFTKIFLNEWLQDIFQNQLFKFVQGAGPIRPLYAVGSGAAKLVVSPAQHYWKEHRLLHEMRKGLKRVSSLYKRDRREPRQGSPTS